MVLSTDERNELVTFGGNPSAPAPPDIGVAIRIDREPAHYPQGSAVLLHGSYRADGALLKRYRWSIPEAITLTLTNTADRAERTLPLFVPTSEDAAPRKEEPVAGPDYRQRGQFRVDLRRFFEIPDAPGRYTVRAALGEHASETLWFEIVR